MLPFVGLILAAVPPLLVALDRWFSGATGLNATFMLAWGAVDFLDRSVFPPYFLLVLTLTPLAVLATAIDRRSAGSTGLDPAPERPSTVDEIFPAVVSPSVLSRTLKVASALGYAVTVGIAFAERRFFPGAYLLIIVVYLAGQVIESVRLGQLAVAFRRSATKNGLIAAALATLILSLVWRQAGSPWQWIALSLFAACVFGLIRFRRWASPAVWITLAAISLYSARIRSWQLAIVGDEYRFFFDASAILTSFRLNEVLARLFDGTWTYGTHPYVSSLIQAAFMFVLGRDNFGWRFSNIFLSAASIAFFYPFFKSLFTRRVALLASLLLASSHYLMNFSKIGYNNLQALFVMGLILWLSGKAARSGHPFAYTALGAGCAACFYVFPGALYLLPLPILIVWLYAPERRGDLFRQVVLAVAAFILLVFPLIIQPDFWESKLAGLFLNSRELVDSSTSFLFHLGSNMLYTLFAFLYIPNESHFVVSSYVDPLTAIFIPIGFGLALRHLRQSKGARFLLLGFLVEAFLVGTTHDRPFPTATRMFLMLPWFFLLAALGIDRFLAYTAGRIGRPYAVPTVAGLVMVTVLGLNLYQSTYVFRQRTAGSAGLETLFLRMLQHDAQEDPGAHRDYLFITEPDWGIDGILLMQDVYKLPASPTQLGRVVADGTELPDEVLPRIARDETIVILQPWMEETTRLAIEAQLSEMGRESCPVRDVPQSDVRFTFWFKLPGKGLCERANAGG